MSLLNYLNCTSDAGNTGIGACALDFKKIVGAILTPKGYKIAAADLADAASLLAKLQADTLQTSKVSRIFPIHGFVSVEDNSTGLQKETFNYGPEAPVRDGINNWTFKFVNGGLTLLKNLRLFNKNNAYDFLFIDDENKILGTAGVDETGAPCLKAIPSMYVWAHQWKANTGQAVSDYKVEFAFEPKYVNEYVAYAPAGFDMATNVTGLQDVALSGTAAVTSGVFNIEAIAGGTNLGDLYDTELAAAGAWEAKNATTGAAITVTGVTYDSSAKKFVVALNASDPDYPATGFVLINLVTPSALAALQVVGFESTGAAKIARN